MIGLAISPTALAARRTPMPLNTINPLVWYDATTADKLWQDTGATVPVNGGGNPVRRIDAAIGAEPLVIRNTANPASRSTGVSFGGSGIDMGVTLGLPASHAVIMAARIDSWTAAHADLFCPHGTNGYGLRAGSASEFLARIVSNNLGLTDLDTGADRSGLHVFATVFDASTGKASIRIDGTTVASATGYNGALDTSTVLKIFGSRYNSASVTGELFGLGVLSSPELTKVSAAETHLKALMPTA